jgi:hypothetical protein
LAGFLSEGGKRMSWNGNGMERGMKMSHSFIPKANGNWKMEDAAIIN